MRLDNQKKLAAQILKCSPSRIKLDTTRLSDIKEAITKVDIRSLITEGVIVRSPIKGISRHRALKIKIQKRKGRQKGHGSRKGTHFARLQKKRSWIAKVRNQRSLLNILREKKLLSPKIYRELYNKSKGGFFRSRRHLHLYIEERGLTKK